MYSTLALHVTALGTVSRNPICRHGLFIALVAHDPTIPRLLKNVLLSRIRWLSSWKSVWIGDFRVIFHSHFHLHFYFHHDLVPSLHNTAGRYDDGENAKIAALQCCDGVRMCVREVMSARML